MGLCSRLEHRRCGQEKAPSPRCDWTPASKSPPECWNQRVPKGFHDLIHGQHQLALGVALLDAVMGDGDLFERKGFGDLDAQLSGIDPLGAAA